MSDANEYILLHFHILEYKIKIPVKVKSLTGPQVSEGGADT